MGRRYSFTTYAAISGVIESLERIGTFGPGTSLPDEAGLIYSFLNKSGFLDYSLIKFCVSG
jgi:hypothetical protein